MLFVVVVVVVVVVVAVAAIIVECLLLLVIVAGSEVAGFGGKCGGASVYCSFIFRFFLAQSRNLKNSKVLFILG